MSTFRKFIGGLIMIFVALPVLFGVIWTVGLTQSFFSDETIIELPKRVMNSLPDLMEKGLLIGDRGRSDLNQNGQAWYEAFRQADISPREVITQSGINTWVENDLTSMLREVQQVMRGKRYPQEVKLNMRPLKEALRHPTFDRYVNSVLGKLPPCDETQMKEWQDQVNGMVDDSHHDIDFDQLPACRPNPEALPGFISQVRTEWEKDIPDQVDVFEDADLDHFPLGMDIGRLSVSFSFLLFIIPAGFLLLGAAVGGCNRQQFFRWFGLFTLIGGLLALGTVYLVTNAVNIGEFIVCHDCSHDVSVADINFLRELGEHLNDWLHPVFNGVKEISEAVSIIGLLIFALSFLLAQARRYPAPAAPANPPPPANP